MSKIIFTTTFVLFFVVGLQSHAQEGGREVSMSELLNLATQGPEVRAAELLADSARSKESSVWRQIYLPKLGVDAGYIHLLTDQGLQLPPLGGMAIPPVKIGPDMISASLSLKQVLFDPANMLYNQPASEGVTKAAVLTSARQVKDTQAQAMDLYLRILELKAKRQALEKYVSNMSGRLREIRRIFELGGLSEGDQLKVKIGIEDSNQGIRELQKGEKHLANMIATLTGVSYAVLPQDLPEQLPDEASCAVTTDVHEREDIKAIDQQIEAASLSQRGNKAEYLPKVYGFIQHSYTNTELVTKSEYDTIGVQLTWALYDGGTNLSNSRSYAQQREALEQKKNLSVNLSKAQLSDAIETLALKRREFSEREKSVIEARQIANLEFARLKNGKTSINNLLDAEDVLKDRSEKASLSKVHWYQAWFACKRASGQVIVAP